MLSKNTNNPFSKPPLSPRKGLNPSYVFSALLISISFLTSLIPFAVYGVAQMAALSGKRVAMCLFGVCVLFLLGIGFLLGSPLFFSAALSAIATAPFLALGILMREKNVHRLWAVLLMLVPVFLSVGSLSFVSSNSLQEGAAHLRQTVEQEIQNANSSSEALQKPVVSSSQLEALRAQVDGFFSSPDIVQFMHISPAERLLGFVFGFGNMLFFFMLLVAFANVVFLDIAYEQVARLRAVATYISGRRSAFPEPFVQAVLSTLSLGNGYTAPQEGPRFLVVRHEEAARVLMGRAPVAAGRFGILKLFLRGFLRPRYMENQVLMKSMLFTLSGEERSWNLRRFRIPTLLSCISVVCIAFMGLFFENYQGMLKALEHSPFLIPLCVLSVLSFVVLVMLSLKGMFLVYTRLVPLLGILTLCVVFAVGSDPSWGPFFLIAFFSTVALLESVYSSKKT